jgi:hypothetical protein
LFRIERNTIDGQTDFDRRTTKGAEAFKLIIEESPIRMDGEVILDSALSKAKERFGRFSSDGSKVM